MCPKRGMPFGCSKSMHLKVQLTKLAVLGIHKAFICGLKAAVRQRALLSVYMNC